MGNLSKVDWEKIIQHSLKDHDQFLQELKAKNNIIHNKSRSEIDKHNTKISGLTQLLASVGELYTHNMKINLPLNENWKKQNYNYSIYYKMPNIVLSLYSHNKKFFLEDADNKITQWNQEIDKNKNWKQINIDFILNNFSDKYNITDEETWIILNHLNTKKFLTKSYIALITSYLTKDNWEAYKNLMNTVPFFYLKSNSNYINDKSYLNDELLFEVYKNYLKKEPKKEREVPLFVINLLKATFLESTKIELLKILMEYPIEKTKSIFKYYLEHSEGQKKTIQLCQKYLEKYHLLNENQLIINKIELILASHIIKLNLSYIKSALNYKNELLDPFIKQTALVFNHIFKEPYDKVTLKIKNDELLLTFITEEKRKEKLNYINEASTILIETILAEMMSNELEPHKTMKEYVEIFQRGELKGSLDGNLIKQKQKTKTRKI